MPMALIDNSRAHIEVNRPARLLLRLCLARCESSMLTPEV